MLRKIGRRKLTVYIIFDDILSLENRHFREQEDPAINMSLNWHRHSSCCGSLTHVQTNSCKRFTKTYFNRYSLYRKRYDILSKVDDTFEWFNANILF